MFTEVLEVTFAIKTIVTVAVEMRFLVIVLSERGRAERDKTGQAG